MVKNPPAVQEARISSRDRKNPWRRKWRFTPVFLPGKSHGQRSLAGYTVHGVAKGSNELHTLGVTVTAAIGLDHLFW